MTAVAEEEDGFLLSSASVWVEVGVKYLMVNNYHPIVAVRDCPQRKTPL